MNARLKIIMLEDSAVDAEIIQRYLKKVNPDIQLVLTSSKDEFSKALHEFNPDLVLADNSLPQFSGADALKMVREFSADMPFILVTGSMTDEFAANIIKSGADDYILKDRLTRLHDAMKAAIKKHKTEKEKQLAIQKLVHSEEKYRSLLETAPDSMIIVNEKGVIQLINAETEKMFGFKGEELIGKNVTLLLPDKYRNMQLISNFESFDAERMGEGFELEGINKEGKPFPVEVRLSPLKTDEGQLTTAAIRNISERKKAEMAMKVMEKEILNQKIQEQKRIARAIIKAQEKERNRIGQELHDNVNQILVGTKLYLEMAEDEGMDVKQLINSSIGLIQKSISEIRILSAKNVTPLKNINLKELLQLLAENLNISSGINIKLEYNVNTQEMEDDLKLNIYRIIQEQLNNIIKHSGARNAIIRVNPDGKNIRIEVADNGKGFDVSKKSKGIGISNMINRVESFNGHVEIDSSIGNGCRMQITLPYES
jgi:two-component system sensor histidine kinase UhpB